MPRQRAEQERQEFLANLRVAVLRLASDDDQPPLAVLLWYGYRPGGTISCFTERLGRKARTSRLIQKPGVLSLSAQRDGGRRRSGTPRGVRVSSWQLNLGG
jgi:hypothetical protein